MLSTDRIFRIVRHPLALSFHTATAWVALLGAPTVAKAEVPAPTGAAVDPIVDAPPPSAQKVAGAPETGFEWGLRLAGELAILDADGGTTHVDASTIRSSGEMSEVVAYGVPLILDLGYRTSPNWLWQVNAQAGLGGFGDACPEAKTFTTQEIANGKRNSSGQECSWSEVRLGLSAVYSFSPSAGSSPWLGLGLHYEWLRVWGLDRVPQDSRGLTGTRELLGGPQINLLGGYAFVIDDSLHIGPYASAAAGMYLTSHFKCGEGGTCQGNSDVEDKSVHAWLSVGVRGSYGP